MEEIKEGGKQRTLNLFCKFTAEERAEKGEMLADKRIEMEDKKSKRSELNNEINNLDKEVVSMSRELKQGGNEKFVKCFVYYNTPKDGQKTIIRTDTNEEWKEDMTDNDYNLLSELDEEPEPPKPLLLPPASIKTVFGFDPEPDGFDFFVGNTVEDFEEHGIDISSQDLKKFARCLYVMASFTDIRELVGPEISWQGYFHSDIENVYWYMFTPLIEPEEVEDIVVVDDNEESDYTMPEETIEDF